jgi:hypothetical protein
MKIITIAKHLLQDPKCLEYIYNKTGFKYTPPDSKATIIDDFLHQAVFSKPLVSDEYYSRAGFKDSLSREFEKTIKQRQRAYKYRAKRAKQGSGKLYRYWYKQDWDLIVKYFRVIVEFAETQDIKRVYIARVTEYKDGEVTIDKPYK